MASKKKTVTKAGASRPRSAAKKPLKTSARKAARKSTFTAEVAKARAARPPVATPPDRLRLNEFSAKFGGVFVGRFPGGKGKPDYNLFSPNDPAALALKAAWGEPIRIQGADSDTDGMANTLDMLKAGSPLAKLVRGLKVHGRSDYYIAAPREARMVAAVAPEAFGGAGYRYTSKQGRVWSDDAVVQGFSGGLQDYRRKSDSLEPVLLRREPIQ
jgi:hypothetical protein